MPAIVLSQAAGSGAVSDRRLAARKMLEVALAPHSLLWLVGDQRGLRIRCASAALWITQDGDPTDYVLGVGEQFTVTGRGRLLLQGLEGW